MLQFWHVCIAARVAQPMLTFYIARLFSLSIPKAIELLKYIMLLTPLNVNICETICFAYSRSSALLVTLGWANKVTSYKLFIC